MFRLWVNTCWEEYTCLCLKTTVAVFGCHFCTNEKWLPWSAPWTGPGDGVCVCTFQKLDPSWTMPCVCLYALWDHTRFTEHTEKLGSLIQCPKTFVFLHRLFHIVCYADCVIGHYILLGKMNCNGNKLATIFESKFTQNFLHGKLCFGLFCNFLADVFHRIPQKLIKEVCS